MTALLAGSATSTTVTASLSAMTLGQLIFEPPRICFSKTNICSFHGSDIGSHSVQVGGFNWNDGTSVDSVGRAFGAAQGASFSSGGPVSPISLHHAINSSHRISNQSFS
jgi:hypothetical protein